MSAHTKRRRKRLREEFAARPEPGSPPGTLVPDPEAPRGRIQVLAYGPEGYDEQNLHNPREIPPFLAKWPVTWVNVDGPGDAALVEELGRMFNLHRLALEDVTHVHQRAKAESYGHYYFVVARMPSVKQWQTEQISFFLGERFVLTFQAGTPGDCLDPVRTRIRAGLGRTRAPRADYLLYALIDTIVDYYFPLLEDCGERLDGLEEIEADPKRLPPADLMARVHAIKRDLLTVRRAIWPLRDALNTLLRDETPLISADTRLYLRDIHDHAIQLIDLVESYRDIASGITDVYLSSLSHRTNEIMKVLTIISTIFIPLTFLAGVYGMNFHVDKSPWNMPELAWYWGYPFFWLVNIAVAAVMLIYFWRRGWIGGPRAKSEPPPSRPGDGSE